MPPKALKLRNLPSMKHMRQRARTIAEQQIDVECVNERKETWVVRWHDMSIGPLDAKQASQICNFIRDGYTTGIIGIFTEE